MIGIDHPYQVAAVDVGGGVAVYPGDPPLDRGGRDVIPAKIDERDRGHRGSCSTASRPTRPAWRRSPVDLDLSRIGVIGHSNGGIAAAGACADARVDACANIDGQLAGGPFSARQDPSAPSKPFMFLTKEIELHPRLAEALRGRRQLARSAS